MSYDKVLYSTDHKGKVRQWSIQTTGECYTVTFGVVGGKMQTKVTRCKPKNVGRANETTGYEQALIEATAKWVFQVDREDYHWNVEEANKQIRPMLALDYLKVPHRVRWLYAVAQRKFDGVRLTYGRRYRDKLSHEAMTRKGEIYTVPHLTEPTVDFLSIVNSICENKCLALDGEAYIHGMSLQNIMSLVKKYHEGETEKVKFYLFDLVIPDMPFEERYALLAEAFDIYDNHTDVFELVPVDTISSEKEMKQFHGKYTELGYEGLMIRHLDAEYRIAGRSPDLFKYKHFIDDECKIIKVWEDRNGNAMLTVLQKNGKECEVTPKRTHEERKAMLANKDNLIDKWITCKFQGYTDGGIMQFPVGKELRECTDEGVPII